jgi:hypothetical protein
MASRSGAVQVSELAALGGPAENAQIVQVPISQRGETTTAIAISATGTHIAAGTSAGDICI